MPSPALQGSVNRLRGSVVFALNQELTITAPYLAREAISISWGGDAAQLLPTLTGGVQSPEPYVMGEITVHVLRSQSLADLFKTQIQTDTNLGSINVRGDSDTLSDFQFENCVLAGFESLTFDGNNAGFVIKIRGVFYVNSALWNAN